MSLPPFQAEDTGVQYVKASVIAKQYSVTERHIISLARRGVIPSERLGKSVRFDPAAVEAAIKSPKEKAAGN